MNIGAIGANALLFLNSQAKSRDLTDPSFAPNTNAAANSAGPQSILPGRAAPQLSFESILSLQSLVEPEAEILEMSPTEIFLAEARKTPMERMREQVLDSLGLTEEALAQMSPEERRAAEDKIREMIEEKIRQAMNAGDAPPDSNGAMLRHLAGA